MQAEVRTQVLVVGAGPTGLSLACLLARYGVDFLLVERNAGITPYSKALGVHARTLEIYDQLGIAEEALRRGAVAGRVRFVAGGRVRGEADLSRLGEGLSPFPFVLVLEQSRNEALLYEYLQALGGRVEWETTLESFTQDAQGVRAVVRTPAGLRTVDADYLVGCDGARSATRERLGLEFGGSTFERTFYVADVVLDWPLSHDAIHVCFAPDSFVLCFPMEGARRYRLVGVFPESFRKDEGQVLYEEIEARVRAELRLPLEIDEVRWFSVYKVHTRHAGRFRLGRCFLAGDAAHIHSPAGAQGMNTGIQDAYNLAWKLALVLAGRAHPQLLETYDAERRANARRLLVTTDRLFQLGAGRGWWLGVLRTRLFPRFARFVLSVSAINRRLFPLLSQIGIHYRDSALSDHEGDSDFAVRAGERMPFLEIEGGNLYHRLRSPRFHLLSFGDEAEALHTHPELVEHHRLPLTRAVAERFGTMDDFHVLLRPDHYIASIGRDPPDAQVGRYLERLRHGL